MQEINISFTYFLIGSKLFFYFMETSLFPSERHRGTTKLQNALIYKMLRECFFLKKKSITSDYLSKVTKIMVSSELSLKSYIQVFQTFNAFLAFGVKLSKILSCLVHPLRLHLMTDVSHHPSLRILLVTSKEPTSHN